MTDSPLSCLSSVVMLTAVCIGSGQTIIAESGSPEVKAGSPTLLGITGLSVNGQIHSHGFGPHATGENNLTGDVRSFDQILVLLSGIRDCQMTSPRMSCFKTLVVANFPCPKKHSHDC